MREAKHKYWCLTVLVAALVAAGAVQAKGGFVGLAPEFDGTSIDIDNPWWPLSPGLLQVHLADEDGECVISVLDVMPFAPPYDKTVIGVDVLTVMDREFVYELGEEEDAECEADLADMDEWELLEITLDWYAQDIHENIWYMGEHSIALDEDPEECDHVTDGVDEILGVEGCLDGSWEAGYDFWEEELDEDILPGIIMLRYPEKGMFYFQEYWEDEATDMGKVLNFKDLESDLFEEPLESCIVIKEWVPLEPGNVEHKYYCEGIGLVLVEGNAGGKTVWTDLVFDSNLE